MGDFKENEMNRFDELTATAMTVTVFFVSYGVLGAVLYTIL